jgi:hypothetical protein
MYPHAIPLWTDKPLWLDGPFLLVDKDYVSHFVLSANLMFALLIRLASLAGSL